MTERDLFFILIGLNIGMGLQYAFHLVEKLKEKGYIK
jgi:hypothetical protein